ncbi:phosphate ABC transporter substrate-binding protein PstS [Cutibacterium sp.]|uniref:phosphate ABC transporter substrate-binding protein PstS n=1 Tax=Cutibacterium sp. TaxID=1912221 RepID=UPI0026DAE15F|nr:phosphate ABC transporter substrate-binding protein PstS [Cutibacterium sp.]MDO4412822.1 phosphate ABC transporter substrate-binding protein PstS [Cutibacterium sp.]
MTNRLAKITALAAISAISLTACGANGEGSSSASSSEATTAPAASSATSADTQSGGSSADAASFKPTCPGGNISGAGSSAQLNAINQVISDYKAACSSATINYSPTGSGAGVKSFIGKQTDWAGSDSALNKDKGEPDKAKQRCNADPWHLPLAAGPIAVVYNVDGVKDLTLSTPTLAKIFSGAIKQWDDPAIKKENPSATLPSAQIEVFYRKDESGTTDNFTEFLNKAAGDIWTEKHSKTWKGAGKGADKSAGVAQAVKDTKNSISYDEWSYATKNNLDMAAIDNGNGPVKLTGESAGKAVSAAKIVGQGNDLQLELQYKDTPAGVYPAVLVTYEIACSKGQDAAKTALLKDFLSFYASEQEQQKIQDLGYAPLPSDVASKVLASAQALS